VPSLRSLVKNASHLSLGVGGAHVVTLLATPLVAKYYGPHSFGSAAGWLAFASLGAAVACLRYETAIALPKSDREAFSVCVLAFLIAIAISLSLEAVLIFLRLLMGAEFLGIFGDYILWIPLGVFVMAASSIFTQWLARLHQIGSLAKSKLCASATTAFLQLLLGYSGAPGGLICGDIAGRTVGILSRSRDVFRSTLPMVSRVRCYDLQRVLISFKHHSLWMTPTALVDVTGQQLPLLLMIALYGETTGGQFSLAQRFVAIPIALLGQSISQVFYPAFSKAYHSAPHQCLRLFLGMSCLLVLASTIFVSFSFVIDWTWMSSVLGMNWHGMEKFLLPLCLLSGVQLVVSTLSQSAVVYGLQKWYSIWVFMWTALCFIGMWFGHLIADSIGAAWGLTICSSVAYFFLWASLFLFILHSSRTAKDKNMEGGR
jgi:O-antigen/teichoic acid export membrane protein